MIFIAWSAICIIQISLNERKFCLWDHGHSPTSRERTVKSESKQKFIEKSRECHNRKPQSILDTKMKREKGKNDHVQNKQTNGRETCTPAPSSPIEVITMLKGMKKHEDKQLGKTIKYEAPHNIIRKVTQNKDNIGTTALERSVA